MHSPQSQEYVIDSEVLIATVQATPVIWNKSHKHYKDRSKRRRSWIQICQSLFEDFESKNQTEKEFISKQIETKWRHIRDNYRREIRIMSKQKPGMKTKRRYVYADALEFLRPIMEDTVNERLNNEDSNVKDEDGNDNGENYEDDEDDDDDSDEPVAPKKKVSSNKWRSPRAAPFDEAMVPFERVDTHSKQEYSDDNDDDTAFFRSLMPMLVTLTPQQKIKFRIEVMQQLLKYQNPALSPSGVQFE